MKAAVWLADEPAGPPNVWSGGGGPRKLRWAATAILVVLVALALFLAVSSRWSYAFQDRDNIDAASTLQHAAGTDALGRDRALRVAVAILLALGGAAAASFLAAILGAAIGVGAAFAPVAVRRTLIYSSDLLLTLPWLFLLMIVRASLPLNLAPVASAAVTFLLLGALGWPVFARIHYARSMALRQADWMLQARATGLTPWRTALTHVLPHLQPVMIAQFLLYLPACITAEANLGTLGLGVREPLPSWGSMLLEMKSTAMLGSTHWVYLPLILLVAVLLLLEMMMFQED